MNKFRLFALRKFPRRPRTKCAPKKKDENLRPATSSVKMQHQVRRVARRVGVALGVRPKRTEEALIALAAQPQSNLKKAGTAKKKVRFDVQAEPSSKKIKRILRKACQYVTLGAMVSAPGILMHPTDPNLSTSHRSSWSSWTEPATWSHNPHMFV